MTEWDKILGPSLAKYTEEVFIHNKKLHIRLNSSTLRQELSFKKSEIVKRLKCCSWKRSDKGYRIKIKKP